ncbi:hypothetical protein [Rhodovibrio sodomensis]|uniref:hypothetical protein n=1 Tax=Rhodovibrio sodomensis TaxID=1088 RepID=UPI001A9319C4|nr:hypothetical protein [Rhodovibrio sodomensis]
MLPKNVGEAAVYHGAYGSATGALDVGTACGCVADFFPTDIWKALMGGVWYAIRPVSVATP